jgi:hypothetical protein
MLYLTQIAFKSQAKNGFWIAKYIQKQWNTVYCHTCTPLQHLFCHSSLAHSSPPLRLLTKINGFYALWSMNYMIPGCNMARPMQAYILSMPACRGLWCRVWWSPEMTNWYSNGRFIIQYILRCALMSLLPSQGYSLTQRREAHSLTGKVKGIKIWGKFDERSGIIILTLATCIF